MKRLLIGSCGGLTGSYLARQFQKKGCYIIGADASQQQATKHFTDLSVCLPPAGDPKFFACLVELLHKERIDYYVPTHSREIREIARMESELRALWDGAFIVCPYDTFEKLDEKTSANQNLSRQGFAVPRMITDSSSPCGYPIFMKKNLGSGSLGACVIENQELHQAYARLNKGCQFYELIRGQEYTVDCMFDGQGGLIGYNQRLRVKNMGGAVIVSTNDYSFDIEPYLTKLSSAFLFKGCVNFQYILSDGIPYIIDVNLRFASGGLPLTVASGLDVPQIMLDLFENRPVEKKGLCRADGRTMYRFFDEWYEDRK